MQRPLIHAEKAKCDGPTNIVGNKVACTQLKIVAGKRAINCWLDFHFPYANLCSAASSSGQT